MLQLSIRRDWHRDLRPRGGGRSTCMTYVALTPDAQAYANTYSRYQDDLHFVSGLK